MLALSPPPPPIAVKPCLLQSRIDASDSAIVLLLEPVCLCLFLTSTTCVVFTDLVLTDVGTHKQNQTCMQSLQVTATCVFCFSVASPLFKREDKQAQTQGCEGSWLHHDWKHYCELLLLRLCRHNGYTMLEKSIVSWCYH